jgi:Protein of unknown function (DUF2442)
MKSNKEPRIQDVMTTADRITVSFDDGRIVSLPLKWFPRLDRAKPAQRRNWELIGRGYGVHWPDVDEDLSAEGFLKGWPARAYVRSLERNENKQKIAA